MGIVSDNTICSELFITSVITYFTNKFFLKSIWNHRTVSNMPKVAENYEYRGFELRGITGVSNEKPDGTL